MQSEAGLLVHFVPWQGALPFTLRESFPFLNVWQKGRSFVRLTDDVDSTPSFFENFYLIES